MHGVLLNIFNTGVLITGKPGIGKSELALALIDRGHQLIADDAPEFAVKNGILTGTCPALLQGLLNIRNLGTINIKKIFGTKAIKKSTNLKLVINLDNNKNNNIEIQNIKMPQINIKKHAILVEAVVRDFLLKQKGYDANLDLINRKHHEY